MVHDHQVVTQVLGFFHVVGGQYDGLSRGLDRPDQLPKTASGLGVEPCGGFVQKHDFGVIDQGQRQQQPLSLTARKFGGELVEKPTQVAQFDEPFEREISGVKAGEEFEDLLHPNKIHQRGGLKLNASLLLECSRGWLSFVQNLATAEGLDALDDLNGGGFSSAIRPQQAKALTGLDMKGNAIDGLMWAVGFAQVSDFQNGGHAIP